PGTACRREDRAQPALGPELALRQGGVLQKVELPPNRAVVERIAPNKTVAEIEPFEVVVEVLQSSGHRDGIVDRATMVAVLRTTTTLKEELMLPEIYPSITADGLHPPGPYMVARVGGGRATPNHSRTDAR